MPLGIKGILSHEMVLAGSLGPFQRDIFSSRTKILVEKSKY